MMSGNFAPQFLQGVSLPYEARNVLTLRDEHISFGIPGRFNDD
jgi:hypothetical protein